MHVASFPWKELEWTLLGFFVERTHITELNLGKNKRYKHHEEKRITPILRANLGGMLKKRARTGD